METSPDLVATIYYYYQFSETLSTQALFYTVSGAEELQHIISSGFAKIKGSKSVLCDQEAPSTALVLCHIQDGRVWGIHDFLNWSSLLGGNSLEDQHPHSTLPAPLPSVEADEALDDATKAAMAAYKPPVYSPLTRTLNKDRISVWIGIYQVEPLGWHVKIGQKNGWTTQFSKVFETDQKALEYATRKIRRDGMNAFNITAQIDEINAAEDRDKLKEQTVARLCQYYGVSKNTLLAKLIFDAQDKTICNLDQDQYQAYLAEEAVDPNTCSLRRCTYVES